MLRIRVGRFWARDVALSLQQCWPISVDVFCDRFDYVFPNYYTPVKHSDIPWLCCHASVLEQPSGVCLSTLCDDKTYSEQPQAVQGSFDDTYSSVLANEGMVSGPLVDLQVVPPFRKDLSNSSTFIGFFRTSKCYS